MDHTTRAGPHLPVHRFILSPPRLPCGAVARSGQDHAALASPNARSYPDGVDSSQAAALAARWRAGTADPHDIARALDELTVALTSLERGRAKVDELIAPVRRLRAASDRAQAFLQETGDKWGH